MSLRQDYFDGASGLQSQLIDAFDNGALLITNNLTIISNALKDAASMGKTTFTVNLTTTFKPTALRANGLLLKAYLDGVSDRLSEENIFSFECTPTLNTADMLNTSIDLKFTFQTV